MNWYKFAITTITVSLILGFFALIDALNLNPLDRSILLLLLWKQVENSVKNGKDVK